MPTIPDKKGMKVRTNFYWSKGLCLAFIFALSVGAAAQDSSEYKEGYADGFRDGFEKGRRKAITEQRGEIPSESRGQLINVTSAIYGPDGGSSCDARRFVGSRLNGRRSGSIDVTNKICGDPSPGDRKSLEITYRCGNLVKTASAYEHRTVYLSCD